MFKQILSRFPRKSPKSEVIEPVRSSHCDAAANGIHQTSNGSSTLSSRSCAPKRTSSVVFPSSVVAGIEPLLPFKDVPNGEKVNLLVSKLSLCCVTFDFSDPSKNLVEKDIKRQTLLELAEFVASCTVKFPEPAIVAMCRMCASNLFRVFPPHYMTKSSASENEDDEPVFDPAWSHLQSVYDILLNFVTSPHLDAKVAKKYIDHYFILRLLDLFDSDDPREKESLKTILHRIYGKFMVHRPFIRKSISNIFYRFVIGKERHNGITELLEIFGSIISGFALPLKEEHKIFFGRALIPLHKPKQLGNYFQQLSYCVMQFIDKDPKLASIVIRGLLKYWPITNSQKEVMFLGETEEILEAINMAEFSKVMLPLFWRVGCCINSLHFQVAERALFLWNNDNIVNLITLNRQEIFPIVVPALERNIQTHWNQAVLNLTINVSKMLTEMDEPLYKSCLADFKEEQEKSSMVEEKRKEIWHHLENVASLRPVTGKIPVLEMILPSSFYFERQKLADFLRKCSKGLLIEQGLKAHAALEKMGFHSDLMLSNDLLDMYGKCGRPDAAGKVFDRMPNRNVVSWTSLMSGYLRNGDAFRTVSLFLTMWGTEIRPNEYTLSTTLKACWSVGLVESGLQIHGVCVKTGFDVVSVVGNSIIDMYAKCGMVEDAANFFKALPVKNAICYNVMIAGYANEEHGHKALLLFQEMQEEGVASDEFSYASVLKAVSCIGAFRPGAQIHASLIIRGFPISANKIVAGALIDLYVKCGCMLEARVVFEQSEEKSVVSWTMLILGYAQNENVEQGMKCFRQLRESGIEIDGFVISSLMGVFADLAVVDQGKQTHCYAMKLPFGLDLSVSNSIVDMYLKCGLVEEAEQHFNEMTVKNVVSWTVMITGYGKHGIGEKAVRLFHGMQWENIKPDEVSYLAVLSACSHSGLVEESREIFARLCSDPNVKPKIEHYACVVDSLGRAGRLMEAKNLIGSMPFRPNAGIWQTLLSACKVHGDVERGREVGNILLASDGENSVNYVLLSNIFSNAGYWKDAEKVREMAKTKGLKKLAGQSWVEIDKKVHIFFGGDDTHPLTSKIHTVLREIEKRMKEESGYTYMVQYALHDVEEESKEANLKVHSEKLALGLALVCGGLEEGGEMIRIFKNLRVCGDCHEFIKGVSKILNKVFLVRDSNRFHKFQNGLCSCKDYW